MRLATAVFGFGLLFPACAAALGPGDLDRSFGVEGTVITQLGPLVEPGLSVTAARDVESLGEGRLLVVGSAPDSAGRRAMAIARYRADGRLDRTFGDGGTVVTQLGSTESSATAVVADDAGGAIVTGTATQPDGAQALALARLGSDGVVVWATTHQIGEGPAPASAGLDLAQQGDGEIVVVGRASSGSADQEPVVARFANATGARDLTFAGRGYVIDPAPRSDPGVGCRFGAAEASAVVLTTTGAIVAGGTLARTCGESTSEPVALLRRYSAVGEPDPAFGAAPPGLNAINALVPGPGTTLLAGGSVRQQETTLPGAARYTPDGEPDGAPGDEFFTPDGFGALAGQGAGAVIGLRMQQTSRVVAAVDGPEQADRVVRLLADGLPDESFGLDGLAAAEVQSPRAVALQPSGDVVVAADRVPISGRQEQAFVLVRLLGGTSASRVAIGARARIRAGAARVKLTCSSGPGCRGTVGGPGVGEVAYAVKGAAREVVEVPVTRRARGGSSLRLKVTNRPQPTVSRTIRLR